MTETFMDRVETLLKEKRITQKEMADTLSLRRPTLSDWKKNGAVPAGDICLKIADYLGVSVEWLISGKEAGLSKSERQLLSMFASLSSTHREELLEIGEQWAAKDKALEKNAGNA